MNIKDLNKQLYKSRDSKEFYAGQILVTLENPGISYLGISKQGEVKSLGGIFSKKGLIIPTQAHVTIEGDELTLSNNNIEIHSSNLVRKLEGTAFIGDGVSVLLGYTAALSFLMNPSWFMQLVEKTSTLKELKTSIPNYYEPHPIYIWALNKLGIKVPEHIEERYMELKLGHDFKALYRLSQGLKTDYITKHHADPNTAVLDEDTGLRLWWMLLRVAHGCRASGNPDTDVIIIPPDFRTFNTGEIITHVEKLCKDYGKPFSSLTGEFPRTKTAVDNRLSALERIEPETAKGKNEQALEPLTKQLSEEEFDDLLKPKKHEELKITRIETVEKEYPTVRLGHKKEPSLLERLISFFKH